MSDPIPAPPATLAHGGALLLDFDGTLVDLAETPDAIHVDAGFAALLDRLHRRFSGRIAIVTGRSLADLERHIGAIGAAVSGSHGFELRAGGRTAMGSVPDGLAAARREFGGLAAADPRLVCEEKPGSVALHFRRAPERAREIGEVAETLAARHALRLQNGKMVVELLPHGVDKGMAVARIMAEPPFAGTRPVFVGDDLTDEHGFAAATAMGGDGVLVGPPRPTAARWRLPDVPAVRAWLEEAANG